MANSKVDKTITGYVVRSLVMLALGAVLTIRPELSINIICTISGALMIVYGLVRIVTYFRHEVSQDDRRFGTGLTAFIGGLLIILLPKEAASILPFVLGFILLVCGVFELDMAMGLMRLKYAKWYFTLISALILVILGLLIVFNPFATSTLLFRFIGISLIAASVLDLIANIAFAKAIKTLLKP